MAHFDGVCCLIDFEGLPPTTMRSQIGARASSPTGPASIHVKKEDPMFYDELSLLEAGYARVQQRSVATDESTS